MRVVYRPVGGGIAEAMGKSRDFSSIKEMFEFIIEQHGHAFELKDIYLSYYGYDYRIDWDTYIVTTSRYCNEDYIEKGICPQAVAYCTFK